MIKEFHKSGLSCLFILFLFLISTAQSQELLFTNFSKEKSSIVERVHSTGLISLDDGRLIKLIGLKPLTPPKQKRLDRDQHGFITEDFDPLFSTEERAFLFVQSLLEKKEIYIEFDQHYRDAEGFIVGYVFLPDGTFINEKILKKGYADLRLAPPNRKYDKKLRRAYREAHQEKRGIHGK